MKVLIFKKAIRITQYTRTKARTNHALSTRMTNKFPIAFRPCSSSVTPMQESAAKPCGRLIQSHEKQIANMIGVIGILIT